MVKRRSVKKYPGLSVVLTVLILLQALLHTNCQVSQPASPKAKACLLIVNYPMVLSESNDWSEPVQLYNALDTLTVYSFNGYKIYKIPGVRVFETDQKVPGSEPFFVFKTGEKFGLYFKTFTDSTHPQKLPIDSMSVKEGYTGVKFTIDSTLKLVDLLMDTNGTLVERYARPASPNPNSIDSMYFYFSKSYNGIDHSLSKLLDSLRKMKLYKVRLLYNEKPQDSIKIIMPKREMFFELQPADVTNLDQIRTLIKRYEKSSQSLL